MTTINFPNDPSIGDEYTFGNKTWVWNGVGWAVTSAQSLFADDTQVVHNSGDETISGNKTFSGIVDAAEIKKNGVSLDTMVGATGGGTDKVFYPSDRYIRYSYELEAGKNFLTSGVLEVGKELNVTSIVGNGATLTVSVDEPHLCAAGDQFEIAGTASFDGVYTAVSAPSSTQVIASTAISAAEETAGSFEKEVVVTLGTDAVWTHV